MFTIFTIIHCIYVHTYITCIVVMPAVCCLLSIFVFSLFDAKFDPPTVYRLFCFLLAAYLTALFMVFYVFFVLLSLWLFVHFSPKCLWPKMCYFVHWISFRPKQNKSFLRSYGFSMFNDKLSSLRLPLLKIINDVKFCFYRIKCI